LLFLAFENPSLTQLIATDASVQPGASDHKGDDNTSPVLPERGADPPDAERRQQQDQKPRARRRGPQLDGGHCDARTMGDTSGVTAP